MAVNPYISASIAIVTVVIMSLLSAVMVIPLLNKSYSKHILSLLTMVAVGCLCGDAIFHLIPHSLGVEDKRIVPAGNATSNKDDLQNDDGGKDMTVVWKCALIIASIYMFYLLNNFMNFCQIGHTHSHGHSHTIPHVTLPIHEETPASHKLREQGKMHVSDEVAEKATSHTDHNEHTQLLERNRSKLKEPLDGETHSHGAAHTLDAHHARSLSCNKLPSVVWMIYIGGALHNVTDGLAIGAAFAGGVPGGISTTLAILFHEVPHAIGDCVVLLSAGLRAKYAMILISSTYLASFVGCYVGVALGQELNIVAWIFAVTAGMFLYIALVELLPDTIDDAEEHGPRNLQNFAFQNIGFFLGTGTMALIAAYEDEIKRAVSF